MSRGHVTHLDPWRDEPTHCDSCGWSGLGRDASIEYFEVIEDVRCPICDRQLFKSVNPTREETEAAAAAGNTDAIDHLKLIDDVDLAHTRIRETPKRRDHLPDLDGVALEFTFSIDAGAENTDPTWLVLTCNGGEIYRERTGYEGWAELIAIGAEVLSRYSERVAWIDPGIAGDRLGGDDLGYATHIQTFLDGNHIAPPTGNWASKKRS